MQTLVSRNTSKYRLVTDPNDIFAYEDRIYQYCTMGFDNHRPPLIKTQ